MKFCFTFLRILLYVCAAFASDADDKYYIEINEKIPDVRNLQKKLMQENSEYNRHFSFRWNMPQEFDASFKNIYQTISADERHLSSMTENQIFEMLKTTPKEFYPYIGPYLHTIPQLTGRILDIPGIKETKNQFPKKIDERFQNIEDIEYASPHLYINLVPADILSNWENKEQPELEIPEYQPLRRQRINNDFLQNALNQTPLNNYVSSQNRQKNAGIRHYITDENTPLSGADVVAFANTLSDLTDFNLQNQAKFISTAYIISSWEENRGGQEGFYFYKQVANPCHGIVRNVKWNNMSEEFQKIIGKNGFGLSDWAQTCEKTLKAYRRASLSEAMAIMLYGLKTNQHLEYYKVNGLTKDELKQLENILGAFTEMYNSSDEDIKAVKPYMNRLYNALPHSSYFLGNPFIFP